MRAERDGATNDKKFPNEQRTKKAEAQKQGESPGDRSDKETTFNEVLYRKVLSSQWRRWGPRIAARETEPTRLPHWSSLNIYKE